MSKMRRIKMKTSKKIYASQWIKIKGKDSEETYKLRKKALRQMEDEEIKLLFDLSPFSINNTT